MKTYLGKGATTATREGDGLKLVWKPRRDVREVRDGIKVPERQALSYARLLTGDVVTDAAGRWHVTAARQYGSSGAPTLYEVDLTRLAS